MKYALGCAFDLHDMFMKFSLKKLKLTCSDCNYLIGTYHRVELAIKIFKYSFKLILNDIIDNNITFILPTGAKESHICMLRFQGEKFKRGRRNGKWLDIDFLESNFSGYLLTLFMNGKRTPRSKPIYVDKNLKSKIANNVNNGMLYC